MKNLLLVLTVWVCCAPSSVRAQVAGSTAFGSLNSPGQARLAALSQAAVAHPEGDVGFSVLNPALLSWAWKQDSTGKTQKQVALSSANWPGSYSQAEMAYGQRGWKSPHWSWGVGVRQSGTSALPLTNASGEVLGTFKAQETMPRLTVAYALSPRWSLGVNASILMATYGVYNASAWTSDIGVAYKWADGLWATGGSVRHLGATYEHFGLHSERLPMDIQWGISQRLKHMPMRWMVSLTHLETPDLAYLDPNQFTRDPLTGVRTYHPPSVANRVLRHVLFGAELTPGGRLRLQISYDFRRQIEMKLPTRGSNAGFSFGMGLQAGKMQWQYANTSIHVAGRLHQFGLARQF